MGSEEETPSSSLVQGTLHPRLGDQIDVVVDPSDYVEDLSDKEEETSPRVRQAKRRLRERLSEGSKICNVKMKKLSQPMTEMYKGELDAYNQMLTDERAGIEDLKKKIQAKEDAGGHGKGAAKGVGFRCTASSPIRPSANHSLPMRTHGITVE